MAIFAQSLTVTAINTKAKKNAKKNAKSTKILQTTITRRIKNETL